VTQPWFPITPSEPATTVTITISGTINATGHFLWTMDGSSFRANYNHPTLLLSNAGNNSYPFDPQWNVYNFGSNESIRFIFKNQSPSNHPMHLHGHEMFVLSEGFGEWDGSIINPENPQRRDTQQVLTGGGFIVVQIDADNPGIWPFHCREYHLLLPVTYNPC
jgi:FtsP/CotA-like multicopper oxidase with cupredoxin domain